MQPRNQRTLRRGATAAMALALLLLTCVTACDPTETNTNDGAPTTGRQSLEEEALRVWTMHSADLRPGEAPPPLNQPPSRFGDHLAAVLENVLAVAVEEPDLRELPPSLVERAAQYSIRVIAYEHLWEVSADPYIGAGCFFVAPNRVRASRVDVLCVPHAFLSARTAKITARVFDRCERFAVLAMNTIDARVVDVLTTRDTPHLHGQLAVCRHLVPQLVMVLTEFKSSDGAPDDLNAIVSDGGAGITRVERPGEEPVIVSDALVGDELHALRTVLGTDLVLADDHAALTAIGVERMRLPAAIVDAYAEGGQLGQHVAFVALSERLATSLLQSPTVMDDVISAISTPDKHVVPQTQPQ